MSVAWVLEASSLSGGVLVVYELCNRLAQTGYDVNVYSLDDMPSWFNLHKKVNWLRYGEYEFLVAAAVNQKPDILIATWWKTALPVAEVVKRTGGAVRGLYLVQDIETEYYHDPVHKLAVLESYTYGLEPFTTSRMVESKIGAYYMGISAGKWHQASVPRQRRVLALARRQALKGYREFTETARYLNRQNVPLTTYGVDDIRTTAMHRHVRNPSNRELERLYSSHAAFISTSLHEGFSLSPLVAMATGTPVVMFDAGGNMEYAVDGENCLIASSPADMAEKTYRVIHEPELARRLSRHGFQTYRRYASWDGPLARLVALIDKNNSQALDIVVK